MKKEERKPNVIEVGNEKTKVIVLDNAYSEISALRSIVTTLNFGRPINSPNYPGIRVPTHEFYATQIMSIIEPLIRDTYGIPPDFQFINDSGTYSLLTTQEDQLLPQQCIAHFDNSTPNHFAVIHYLNKGKFGGTSFYRHRSTNFESVSLGKAKEYQTKLLEDYDNNLIPTQKYLSESNKMYELLNTIDYKENRIAIYPTSILHSGHIDRPEKNINNDPTTGRLTGNFFVSFEIEVN